MLTRRHLAVSLLAGAMTAAAACSDDAASAVWSTEPAEPLPFGACGQATYGPGSSFECADELAAICAGKDDEASCNGEPYFEYAGGDLVVRCGWIEVRKVLDRDSCALGVPSGRCGLLLPGVADTCNRSCEVFDETGDTLWVNEEAGEILRTPCGPDNEGFVGPMNARALQGDNPVWDCYASDGPDLCWCAADACERGAI